jgi:hypothetical protein
MISELGWKRSNTYEVLDKTNRGNTIDFIVKVKG